MREAARLCAIVFGLAGGAVATSVGGAQKLPSEASLLHRHGQLRHRGRRHGEPQGHLSLHRDTQTLLGHGAQRAQLSANNSADDDLGRGTIDKFVPGLMGTIDKFRAEKCADMHLKHGEVFKAFDACWKFMKTVCNPGGDKMMDGDKGEMTSGSGFCKIFFPPEKKEKEEDADKDSDKDAVNDDNKKSQELAQGVKDSDGDGFPDDKDAFKDDPAEHLDSDGDGVGDNADDDDDGDDHEDESDAYPKDPKRWKMDKDEIYHMDEKAGAPAQGFHGPKVAHNDQETSTEDWNNEYGPGSGTLSEEDLREMCQEEERPTWWCLKYGARRHLWGLRSSAHLGRSAPAVLLPALLLLLVPLSSPPF